MKKLALLALFFPLSALGQAPSVPMYLAGIGSPNAQATPPACSASVSTFPIYWWDSSTTAPTVGRSWRCDDSTGVWQWNLLPSTLSGTSVSIGGSLLALGTTTTGTGAIPGSRTGQNCVATTSDGTFVSGVNITCNITSNGVATVTLQAFVAGTPAAKTYNVRLLP